MNTLRLPATFAAAALALLAVSCGRAPLRDARISPALQKLIPRDTTMLVDVHVDRLRNSEVYQRYLSQVVRQQSDQVAGQTGIDPSRDIDEILSCSDGKNTIVFNRFNRDDARSRFHGDGTNTLTFVDKSIGVLGPAAAVKSVVDQAKAGAGGIPEALSPVVDDVPAQDQIVAAMVGGVPGVAGRVEGNPNLANLVRLAQSIESASLGVQVDKDVHVHARADCRSEEDSRQVHDALRGFVALGRLATPANRPELLKIYDAITVTREKSVVRVTAMLGEHDLGTFLSLWLNNRKAR